MSMRPGRAALTVALSVPLLASCTGEISDAKAYAQRPEIVAARQTASVSLDAVFTTLAGVGQTIGTTRLDMCEAGHSNLFESATYRFRCSMSRGAIIAPAASDTPTAVAAMQDALRTAGCSGTLPATAGLTKLDSKVPDATNIQCGQVEGALFWTGSSTSIRYAGLTHNANTDLEYVPYDDAAAAAVDSTKPFAWVLRLGVGTYVNEK